MINTFQKVASVKAVMNVKQQFITLGNICAINSWCRMPMKASKSHRANEHSGKHSCQIIEEIHFIITYFKTRYI